jgi:hypothetical protein
VLIEAGADKEARNPKQQTSLHLAAALGKIDVCRALMEAGADKEARDAKQRTPLHWAAHERHVDVCRALMEAGADKEARNPEQQTPLYVAAAFGNADVCQALMQAGADKEAGDDFQMTPLHRAAMNGNIETCQALMQAGADKEARDNDFQMTPLHWAAYQCHESICLALVLAGANRLAANVNQNTTTEIARSQGHITLANHMQHSGGVHLLRCTGPSRERKLVWDDTSEAEEEAMLDVMQAEWLAKVAQGRAHARVGQVLQRVHRGQVSMELLTHILGFAIGGTAAHLMSCVSQRLSTAAETVEQAATAEPPSRRQRIDSGCNSSGLEQALRSPRLALMSHQLALSITPTVLCSALGPPQRQRLREAVSALLEKAAAVVAQGEDRGSGRVEAGCKWLEEYCIFVQGCFQL